MNMPHVETVDSRWKGLYILAGTTALISVLLVLLDIFISIVLPEGEVRPGARAATDWFALLQNNRYYGLRDLGLLNILNSLLGVPLFLALFAAHRHINIAYAALALLLFVFGGTIYIANNPALPMLALAETYAAATTAAQQSSLAAAGEALLARGADFTFGSLIGFVVPSIGSIIMSLVMLRGGIFSKTAAAMGMLGYALLLIFTIWTTFAPSSFDVAMLIALPGGLLVLAWNILVARKLFQLARGTSTHAARPGTPQGATATTR